MNRRIFLKNSIAGTTFIGLNGLALSGFESSSHKHITILHTNDVHSHIDPFPENHPKFASRGGIVNRASLIERIRNENPNLLLLDAGDSFQGTPYFNFYGGELEFTLMSKLGYNASTIGNHEFDNGIDGLASQIQHAKFDLINCNYDFSNTIMEGLTKPYKIYIVDGIKIGVLGVGVELKGLVDAKMYKETQYIDPVEVVSDVVKKLKNEEKCNLIIVLSHLGYNYSNEPNKISDLKLAAATQDIDLIIGGHTHTFLEKPVIVKNKRNQDVIVNQVGCFGVQLGRIDFYLEQTKIKDFKGKSIEV